MLPTGSLMIEHRLIEKMISRIAEENMRIERSGNVDHDFIVDALDFMRNFADRCHHGKEEDILFREMRKKKMPPELEATLNRLVEEHKISRGLIGTIDEANVRYRGGEGSAKDDIVNAIERMTTLYPQHIEEEDRRFFPKAMDLFTREEKDAMIAESNEFDRKLILERYTKLYERWTTK
ncbi:MAG: hemerythrin domain-containing protein [Euryarchaeota archaeon]|nr:hemerythrin domain-containing protein [Euryarchaeota archaeon]